MFNIIINKLLKYLEDNKIDELYSKEMMTMDELKTKFHISDRTLTNFFKLKNIKTRPAKRREILRDIPPIGTKFGQWTVISNEIKKGNEIIKGSKNRNLYVKCRCNCGNISWKSIAGLKRGQIFGCKRCSNKTYIDENGGEVIVSTIMESIFNHVYNGFKTRNKLKGMDFNITPKYLEELYLKQDKKCALSGIDISFEKGI